MASSTELSTTSQTRWWRPLGPVEPMYMPGRCRTGSRPSRTVMSSDSYEDSRFLSPSDEDPRFLSTTSGSTFSATNAPFHILERQGEPLWRGPGKRVLRRAEPMAPVYQEAVVSPVSPA